MPLFITVVLILKGKNLRTLVIGTIIFVVAIVLYYNRTPPTDTENSYGDVHVEQAKTLIESRPSLIILDVRTQEEYENGHIEKAILIPVSELENRMDELSKDNELLVYCRTGNRSSNAVRILRANGFMRVFHMKDGITAWIQAGYSTVV
jgi:rhodanese-related sulfurtransferase